MLSACANSDYDERTSPISAASFNLPSLLSSRQARRELPTRNFLPPRAAEFPDHKLRATRSKLIENLSLSNRTYGIIKIFYTRDANYQHRGWIVPAGNLRDDISILYNRYGKTLFPRAVTS